jgi:alkyl hydroperoxide reductase subunit AhpC
VDSLAEPGLETGRRLHCFRATATTYRGKNRCTTSVESTRRYKKKWMMSAFWQKEFTFCLTRELSMNIREHEELFAK